MLDLPEKIESLLVYDTTTGVVSTREGKRLEFKRDFVKADFSDYTKVLASFSNALGGVIIFGVSDSPRHVEGCAAFPDEADWANRLREDFDPEIPFAVRAYRIGAVTLHVVGVGPGTHKPVLCKKTRSKSVQGPKGQKDVEVLREGSIYYRYSGQTRQINYPDLSTMLAERESMYLRKMIRCRVRLSRFLASRRSLKLRQLTLRRLALLVRLGLLDPVLQDQAQLFRQRDLLFRFGRA